ncbi:MAG TPA: hypothetical protein VNH11_04750 [Pirellulales bacterium]|nr:hypothetical protein [Pirellulales bacterium]
MKSFSVYYTFVSDEWRFLLPRRASFKEAWLVVSHDLRLGRVELPPRKFNAAQQFAYTCVGR